jgi:hypothetical protein
MDRKIVLTLAGAAVGALMAFGTAQAAPVVTGQLEALKTLGVEQGQVATKSHWRSRSHWRRCHRRWRSGWRC